MLESFDDIDHELLERAIRSELNVVPDNSNAIYHVMESSSTNFSPIESINNVNDSSSLVMSSNSSFQAAIESNSSPPRVQTKQKRHK